MMNCQGKLLFAVYDKICFNFFLVLLIIQLFMSLMEEVEIWTKNLEQSSVEAILFVMAKGIPITPMQGYYWPIQI